MANNTRIADDRIQKPLSLVDRIDNTLIGLAKKWKLLVLVFGGAGLCAGAVLGFQAWQQTQAEKHSEAFFAATWGETLDAEVLKQQAEELAGTVSGARAAFALIDDAIEKKDYTAAQQLVEPWRDAGALPILVQVRFTETAAYLYEMLGEWNQAGETYARALQLYPDSVAALSNAVRCFNKSGDATRVDQLLSASASDSVALAEAKKVERIARELKL